MKIRKIVQTPGLVTTVVDNLISTSKFVYVGVFYIPNE